MSTKAVIFDLDDTLISEVAYAMSGYRAVAGFISGRDAGIIGESDPSAFRGADSIGFSGDAGEKEEIFKELVRLFNEDHKNVFNRFLKGRGLEDSKEAVMELVNVYRKHLPEIDYFDDVRPALRELRGINRTGDSPGAGGIILGILSDGYSVTQRQKVKALEAEKDFDIIILTDEIGREAWKPSPAGFRILEERFGLKRDEILYVGDNPEKDFFLSKTAGIKTVRILREGGVYNNRDYLNGVRENYRVETLEEIPDLIKGQAG